jgi:hypothetical protein
MIVVIVVVLVLLVENGEVELKDFQPKNQPGSTPGLLGFDCQFGFF